MANVSSSNSLGERVPKLRFPEFEGEWDFELFSDLFTFLSNNTLSRAELSETGNIRNIHYGDILVKYTDVINVDDEIIPFVSNASESKVRCGMLRTGDVIIADTAEDATVGKAIEIINYNNKPVVSGLHTMPCRPNRDFTASFLGYYINSNAYHSQLYPYMQGIKVTSISKANIGKTLIHFPSRSEQKKIVELFNLIEKNFLIQKKLVKALKLYKRGLLSKLFPQKGKGIPQYRFKEFTDVWKQRKVTELGNIYIGLVTTMTAHYTDHGTLLIRNSDIKDGKFVFDSEPIYLDDEFSEVNKSRRHKVGDVITVHTGDVGTSAVITENEANSIGFATIVTRPNKEILDSYYLSVFLNTDKHKNWAVQMSTGDGRTNYNLREYTELIVPVPAVDEQKKIAKFIMTLNNLITLHQRKYNSYKKEKLALLQQMFI